MKDYIISKKDFLVITEKIFSVLNKNKKVLFSIAGITLACLASIFFWCGSLIFCLSIIAAVIVFFCLKFGNVVITSAFVRIGWSCIIHALLTVIMNLLQTGTPPDHTFGCIASLFVCAVLYSFIPIISYYMKLNDKKEGRDLHTLQITKNNGSIGITILYMIVFIIILIADINAKTDYDFGKEDFVKVSKWEIENHHGNTYYIVTCSKGRIIISPNEYPEIRDINANTQIKVLTDISAYQGLLGIKKIEIKNK